MLNIVVVLKSDFDFEQTGLKLGLSSTTRWDLRTNISIWPNFVVILKLDMSVQQTDLISV